jgi:hypothetical protein
LLVDENELGEERNGTETRLSGFGVLSEDEERDGAQNNGTGGDTSLLGFFELLKSLVEDELEISLL